MSSYLFGKPDFNSIKKESITAAEIAWGVMNQEGNFVTEVKDYMWYSLTDRSALPQLVGDIAKELEPGRPLACHLPRYALYLSNLNRKDS